MENQKSRDINSCSKVRATCEWVLKNSKMVSIQDAEIDKFILDLSAMVQKQGISYDKWSDWHLDDPGQYTIEQITAYVFVVDAMNFCFWPNNPSGNFEYDSMTRNLEKILKNDPEFFKCDRLICVTEDFLRENVFNGMQEFCLVDERARIINEMAAVIENEYNSSFYDFVVASGFDCVNMVNLIV